MVEMVSPVNSKPTLSTNNMNGFMASILAWVRDPDEVIGSYPFAGFQIHSAKNLDGMTDTCKRALTQKIMCAPILKKFQEPGVGIFIKNSTVADQFCDPVCAASLKSWFDNVSSNCADQTLGASDPTRFGGYMYANYNLTCMQDPSTGEYCMPFVNSLPVDDGFTTIPIRFMCSYCLTTRLIMIMSSAYTAKPPYVSDLEWIHYSCGMELPAEEPPSLVIDPPSPPPFCISGQNYTIQEGDTCDTIAWKYHVASAALQSGNPTLINNCSDLIDGRDLCLPLRCDTVYTLKDNDTCFSIEREHKNLALGSVRTINPWINYDCSNLQDTREIVGSVICLSPQGGTHNSSYMFLDGGVKPLTSTGYTDTVMIPPSDANIAKGTTKYCGSWHKVADGETCASICMREGIPHNLFVTVNPSLQPESSEKADCDSLLSTGVTYCVGPDTHWNDTGFWGNDSYFFGDYLSLFD